MAMVCFQKMSSGTRRTYISEKFYSRGLKTCAHVRSTAVQAPARARDLPAVIDRGEMGWGWWSSEARQRRLLATRSAATCRNYGAVPAVHHIQTREPRHQVQHGAQTEAVGWHRGRRWFARVELAKPSKICGGCGSAARPPLGPKLGSF